MKRCSKCGVEKDPSNYHKDKRTTDGLNRQCKACWSAYRKAKYPQVKEYYADKCKRWREQNNQYNKDRNKQWMQDNKERRKAYKRKYRSENRDAINAYKRKQLARDMKNPIYRLEQSLRRKLRKCVKKVVIGSYTKASVELLGCDLEFFKQYLEEQFTTGMTWDSYGPKGWHMDHIIPVCSFDLSNPDEVARCFRYTNIQPLWAEDNAAKGSKIPQELLDE